MKNLYNLSTDISGKLKSSDIEKMVKKYPKVNFWIVNGPAVKLHEKIAERSSYKLLGYPSTAFIKNNMITNFQIGGNQKTFEENIKTLLKD